MTRTDSEIIPVYTGETDSKMESIMKVKPKSGVLHGCEDVHLAFNH